MKQILSSLSLLGSYAALTVTGLVGISYSAHAAEGKACYEQFSEAKKAGTLTEKNFKEFKVAHCYAKGVVKTPKSATTTEPNKSVTPVAGEVSNKVIAKDNTKEPVKKEAVEKAPVTIGDVVFPDKIDAQFASEKEGTARMHTCQKQYNANKVSSKNGGLKWIQKGGGYYSECNKHLKSAVATK
ncbi:hypothetical protein HK18_06605 [Commensalibacter intestini]|uniref:Uncharacterized protein n=1 Tax=Commensalibacter intestini TaxID=479936 RepID=A0A251ZSF9_9PROT|nr:hypothetical protein [Commensalibacter intestini]OUI77591.1 hypothetical protein HK18_06605 [Commensalibacter intestini]